MEQEQKNFDLINNLVHLLKNLNFLDIQIKGHPTYSDPAPFEIDGIQYQPPLVAQKNEVIYYFEFIDEDLSQLKDLQHPIQKMVMLGDQRWEAEFVLVTQYGNKESVRKCCQGHNLLIDQIWEL